VRNARRDANKLVETEHKGSILTEDQSADAKTQIQDLTKQYEGKIDELVEHKKQEVMQV
jgi:ribosome recycling factor